jgi:hypothetical protein
MAEKVLSNDVTLRPAAGEPELGASEPDAGADDGTVAAVGEVVAGADAAGLLQPVTTITEAAKTARNLARVFMCVILLCLLGSTLCYWGARSAEPSTEDIWAHFIRSKIG